MSAISDLIETAANIDRKTLRDEFAKAALIGMLSSWNRGTAARLYDEDVIVREAYGFADAMLKERDKNA